MSSSDEGHIPDAASLGIADVEDSVAEYMMSSWGKRQIILNNYIYRKQKVMRDRSYWNCTSDVKHKCKAKLHVIEDGAESPSITKIIGEHYHDPPISQLEERLAVSRLKSKVLESGEPIHKAMKRFIVDEPSIADKGKSKVQSAIRKVKRRVRQSQGLPLTEKKRQRSRRYRPAGHRFIDNDSASLFKSGFIKDYDTDANKLNNSSDTPSIDLTECLNYNGTSLSGLQNLQVEIQVPEISDNLTNMNENLYSRTCLLGQVALVTGASSGIGKAIAEALARAGASVCIAARREDKLNDVWAKIDSEGGIGHQYHLDVTDRSQFLEVVETIQECIGPIDILINNAGCMFYTHMHNAMMDDWDKMIEVNCRGLTNGIGCVLPGMVERGKGHIVNTSSDVGRKGCPGLAVYSATKFFVEGLSQSLRQEVKGKGVKVTCIQPGDVTTEIGNYTKDLDAQQQYDTMGTASKILDPEDIGRAVLYAVTQPDHCGVNEILIEPKEAPV